MAIEELTMILGGAQGAGLNTSQEVLSTAFASSGFGVIADREYFSNIKGRHSYVHTRASSTELPRSLSSGMDLLACMDAETLFTHFDDLKDDGYLIYDANTEEEKMESISSIEDPLKKRLNERFEELDLDGTVGDLVDHLESEKGIEVINLNYEEILKELQEEFDLSASQTSRYISSIIIGGVSGLMDLDEESINQGLKSKFKGKGELAEQNKFLAAHVADLVKEEHGSPLQLQSSKLERDEYMLSTGNETVGMSKIVGGLRYQSYYPITPAADESFFIDNHADLGDKGNIAVFQTEDELSAIGGAIGAALTGARSATATSGPGFSLMVEGLGWAGMNEVPVVITYYQRGGPSTGLPTRGSQADLLSALHASQGEFPLILLTSGDQGEAFDDAVEAFNLAEEYQTPVIHMLDKFLANSTVTMDVPDISSIEIRRGNIADDRKEEDYRRFEDGPISERRFLGDGKMWYTGSEHDEYGNVSEDPENRMKMQEKRMEKLEVAREEIPDDKMVRYYGPEEAEFLLVGWGSVKGVALDVLEDIGKGAYLHLKTFSPFPKKKVRSVLDRFDPSDVIAVEHSYTGQAAKVIAMKTGVKIEKNISKYTGRPIYEDELKDAIKSSLDDSKEEVLSHGP